MPLPTRPFGQPSPDRRGLVRDAIVHDEMDVEFARYGSLDIVQKRVELGGVVAPVALANDPSGRNIEGGEQRCGAISFVVMGLSL